MQRTTSPARRGIDPGVAIYLVGAVATIAVTCYVHFTGALQTPLMVGIVPIVVMLLGIPVHLGIRAHRRTMAALERLEAARAQTAAMPVQRISTRGLPQVVATH